MPIRMNPTPKAVSLKELFHFVQFGRFWPSVAPGPVEALSSGDQSGGDIATIQAAMRLMELASRDIFQALRDGTLVGRGRYSGSVTTIDNDWKRKTWTNHEKTRTEIDADFWSDGGINWDDSSAKNAAGEFIDIVFSVSDVFSIWPADPESASSLLVPASDRIVRRDDNSAAYDEAVKSLDETISAVEKANDLGELSAEERVIVLSQLREGRKLFDLPEVKVSAVQAMIVPALRWVADKLGGEVVVSAAAAAITALSLLLKVML